MSTSSHIGIWMDYHHAFIIKQDISGQYSIAEASSRRNDAKRIAGESADGTSWGNSASSNEYTKNRQEEADNKEYFKMLKEEIRNFSEILIFGPTRAGDEFFNLLMEDKTFAGKKVEREKSDKLTDNQMIAFVREHFEKVKKKV